MENKPRFTIGTQFIHYAYKKQKAPRTITDILTTKNISGEVVKIEYVTEHYFYGQTIKGTVTDTAIARSLVDMGLPLPD